MTAQPVRSRSSSTIERLREMITRYPPAMIKAGHFYDLRLTVRPSVDGMLSLASVLGAITRTLPPQCDVDGVSLVPTTRPHQLMPNQADLATPASVVGRNHPETAKEAAALALPKSPSRRADILAVVAMRGDHGVTDDDLERMLSLSHQTASAARNGLTRHGWLIDSGRARKTTTGRRAIVWVLSEAAKRELAKAKPAG